jgi:hypothetical protein
VSGHSHFSPPGGARTGGSEGARTGAWGCEGGGWSAMALQQQRPKTASESSPQLSRSLHHTSSFGPGGPRGAPRPSTAGAVTAGGRSAQAMQAAFPLPSPSPPVAAVAAAVVAEAAPPEAAEEQPPSPLPAHAPSAASRGGYNASFSRAFPYHEPAKATGPHQPPPAKPPRPRRCGELTGVLLQPHYNITGYINPPPSSAVALKNSTRLPGMPGWRQP